MTDIHFPDGLPSPRGGSLSEGEQRSWVEDTGEVGSPRRRNRFTRSLASFNFTLRLSDAQKVALVDFYETDLERGVQSFLWTHPTTAKVYEVRFVDKPGIRHLEGSVLMWDAEVGLAEV